jgi:hypothetical protein
MTHLSTGLATLLVGAPKDFGLDALIASEYLQEEDEEDLFAAGHRKSRRQ